MKCPKCKSKMEKVEYDIGFEVSVDSYTCPNCMLNITDRKRLDKLMHKLRGLIPPKFLIYLLHHNSTLSKVLH